jgi:hypothetical protein
MCRNGAYRGDGAFGQYVVVLPEHDAVVTMTGGLADMQLPLDAVWQTLLPAFDTTEPDVAVPVPRATAPAGGEAQDREFAFTFDGPIRRVRVAPGRLELDECALDCVPDEWMPGELTIGLQDSPLYSTRVATSGGWHGDRFVAHVRTLEDAPTFRVEVTTAGHLTITRDVGFDGADVWEGDALASAADQASRSAGVDHQSVVSP